MDRIAVIGAGAWGTALGKVLADKGYPVRLWARHEAQAAAIAEARENTRYLPGVPLPASLTPTASLEEALRGADLVVLVVPSHALRETVAAAAPHLAPGAVLVNATKGIENDTLMIMAEVVADVLGPGTDQRFTVLTGPSFAREVAAQVPTNIVVASSNAALAVDVQRVFATDWLRVYSSDDPIGVEVGGALKNVIAIAAGACDGLGFGHNTRAALVTRGLAEVVRIAIAKGGNVLSIAGLAGLGDLVLTCTGDLSRNRTVGFELGRGKKLEEVLASLGHVAEGVKTAKSVHDLARRLDVDLPICNEVYRVLYEGKSPQRAVEDVLTRPLKREWS
ncbi:MAG TPA: NAD(P)H-dependent glycerol-3-phosphate dehydrogenase [Polyangiaceae bacterium]|jgi:glycerol-3-phosphate dehydrogenase (NAD(P)+)|nr:NAD(P)H-dependent glycerol-3-phosphate dehydrogenase [Polyangiaceae bacterium]